MKPHFFVSIDFDGTVAPQDVTDAVVQRFSHPGWEIAERLWVEGKIGSRECLSRQVRLIDASIGEVLRFVDSMSIDPFFPKFAAFLQKASIPFAIISDGFQEFIRRILGNTGFSVIPPIIANKIHDTGNGLEAVFPNAWGNCLSGTCKCTAVDKLAGGLPIVLIGDGRSDFCLARKAAFVISKSKLRDFCVANGLPGRAYIDFSDVIEIFQSMNQRGCFAISRS